jgi:predicted small lipoprotein YifL
VSRPQSRGLGLLVVLAVLLAAAGCGRKGPPVAPERRLPAAPAGMSATVEADSIVVSWTVPRTRVDGTALRDLALTKLFRRAEAAGEPAKSAMVSRGEVVGWEPLAAIRPDAPAPAVMTGNTVRWVDRHGLTIDHRYIYVATVIDSTGRSSAPSERLAVLFLAAPGPPEALAADAGDGEVRLAWKPPAGLVDGSPLRGDISYVVLRGAGAEGALQPVQAEPATGTTHVDRGLANETTYRYVVRAVRKEGEATAYGEPSMVATATPMKRTPPAAPGNLLAIPSETLVRLTWTASASPDVAAYAIYRATGTGAFVRIGTTPAINIVFTDRDVKRGEQYRYAVTALDSARTPNESPQSNVVTVTIP